MTAKAPRDNAASRLTAAGMAGINDHSYPPGMLADKIHPENCKCRTCRRLRAKRAARAATEK